jgi:pimeloyl-ACP methyl ester carboxylesterase
VKLNHVRRGAGEPLLLLHALGGTLGQWAPVLDRLAEQRDVLAVDMPGFGGSPALAPWKPSTANELAQTILGFAGELGFGDALGVAGISLGAWVAIECAREGGAAAVVGLCPAGLWRTPPGPRRAGTRVLARAMRPLLPALRSEAIRRRALGGVMRHPERMSGREAVQLARAYAGAKGYAAASEEMRAGAVGDLSDLAVPVTLAWGEHDALVRRPPPGTLPPHVSQVDLPGCGHVPTWDDPALVSRVILEGTAAARPPRTLTAPA